MSPERSSPNSAAKTRTKAAVQPAQARRRVRPGRQPSADPAQRLARELEASEKALHEVVASFAERVAGQLERAARAVTSAPAPKRAVIAAMTERLREVKLKPERGRLKDLARLQDLAEDLVDLLPDA